MNERRKLELEHMMLDMHRMRLRFGHVIRTGMPFLATVAGRCIDCGIPFTINTSIKPATWPKLDRAGFYAHLTCPDPYDVSEWLRDTSFISVFDYAVQRHQWCRLHSANECILRVSSMTSDNFTLRYGCGECIA